MPPAHLDDSNYTLSLGKAKNCWVGFLSIMFFYGVNHIRSMVFLQKLDGSSFDAQAIQQQLTQLRQTHPEQSAIRLSNLRLSNQSGAGFSSR